MKANGFDDTVSVGEENLSRDSKVISNIDGHVTTTTSSFSFSSHPVFSHDCVAFDGQFCFKMGVVQPCFCESKRYGFRVIQFVTNVGDSWRDSLWD